MKKVTVLAISALVLIGCGGGGASGGDNTPTGAGTIGNDGKMSTVDVKYTLNGSERPTCHNADDIGNIAPDNNDFVLCTWSCGRYGGHTSRGSDTIHVWLWFRKSERTDQGIWELSDEDLSESNPMLCRDM